MKKTLITLAFLIPVLAYAKATLQNEDFKSKAQLEAAGGTQAQLLNTDKIYDLANSRQLSASISSGLIGGAGGTFKNFLSNAGFETGATAGWTASAGTLAATNTASNLYAGNYSGSWTPAAGSNTLINTAFTITSGGGPSGNAGAKCSVKTASNAHKMQILDGSNVVSEVTITGATSYVPVVLTAAFPSTSSGMNLRFLAGDTTPIYIDECFFGDGNVVNGSVALSQAEFVGSVYWQRTTSCQWGITNQTSYTDFSVDTDCDDNALVYEGSAIADTSNPGQLPQIRIQNPKPGRYFITVKSSFIASDATDPTGIVHAQYAISDDTNTFEENLFYGSNESGNLDKHVSNHTITGQHTYTTTPGSGGYVTFKVRGKTLSGAGKSVFMGATLSDQLISVYRFPLSSQIAVTPEQQSGSFLGIHYGGNWSTTSPSLVVPTGNAGITFATIYNNNFGTVATTADGTGPQPGITITPKKAGNALVCATFGVTNSTSGSGSYFDIYDTTAATILIDGVSTITGASYGTNASRCFTMNFPNVSAKSINIRLKAGANTAVIDSAGGGVRAITWAITWLDQSLPMPVIVNSVSTPSDGQEKLVRATLSNGGSCAVTSQSGTWISSVADPGAGLCTMNVASGTFSATPACFCTTNTFGGDATFCRMEAISTSQIKTYIVNSSNTPTDTAFNIMCIGPR